MPALTGYTIDTITNLRNIGTDIRTTGYIRAVTDAKAWFMFIADATDTPDEVNILSPLAGTGRWFKLKGVALPSDVIGLTEYIQDVIGASFLQSTHITFVYDDAGNILNVTLANGSITNAHISSSAAIAQSKIANLSTDLGTLTTSIATLTTDLAALDSYVDTQLATKADLVHTHTASNITDFSEAVDDRIAALLVQGTNITIDYNDSAHTLTLSAGGGGSGGGGGFDWDTIDESSWDATY